MVTVGEKLYNKMPEELKALFTKLPNLGSPEVLAGFPNSKSSQHDGDGEPLDTRGQGWGFKRMAGGFSDSGSASRFFYCAKSSKSERDYGLEDRTKEITSDGREKSIDNPFLRGETARHNSHPTVKPLSLMTYLIKLITPPKGIVLDIFAGSGSTLVAAKTLGHPFIGIEKEADYLKIAEARVKAVPKPLFDI